MFRPRELRVAFALLSTRRIKFGRAETIGLFITSPEGLPKSSGFGLWRTELQTSSNVAGSDPAFLIHMPKFGYKSTPEHRTRIADGNILRIERMAFEAGKITKRVELLGKVRVVEVTSTGCWLWLHACKQDGYPVLLTDDRKQRRAHRVSYETFLGPISAGLDVCHTCDVRNCIAPHHFFLGTDLDNHRDKTAKGRHGQTKKTHCPKGHPYDEVNTYFAPSNPNHRKCRTCRRIPLLFPQAPACSTMPPGQTVLTEPA